jgi:hypothetical protein
MHRPDSMTVGAEPTPPFRSKQPNGEVRLRLLEGHDLAMALGHEVPPFPMPERTQNAAASRAPIGWPDNQSARDTPST